MYIYIYCGHRDANRLHVTFNSIAQSQTRSHCILSGTTHSPYYVCMRVRACVHACVCVCVCVCMWKGTRGRMHLFAGSSFRAAKCGALGDALTNAAHALLPNWGATGAGG